MHVAKKRETIKTATTAARLRWPRMEMEEPTEEEGKTFTNGPVRGPQIKEKTTTSMVSLHM